MNITIDYPFWLVCLALVFALAWLIQLVLQLWVWLAPLRHARRTQTSAEQMAAGAQPGVSVLVYSRNQAEALARNLPTLLHQNYPDYEVIVLDDCSLDDTQDVLGMMDQRSDRLFHTRIDERARAMSHRKLAVLLGAKASHYEVILMTHAECLPASEDWIAGMMRHFANPAVEVVLGPVAYERRTGFLSRFCQFDFFQRLLLLFGITLSTRGFAGWGQNLAFRKSTFYANRSQGFQRHLKMQPGEDDLFVADVARQGNVAVECQASSLVTDQAKPLFVSWSLERLNRGFTSRLYAWLPSFIRGLDYATRYLTVLPGLFMIAYTLYIIIGAGGVHPMAWAVLAVVLLLLLARAGLMAYTYRSTARVLKLHPMLSWPLLLDLYTPMVDLWFRCKALLHKGRFGVSRIGLQ